MALGKVSIQAIRNDYRRLAAGYDRHWRTFGGQVYDWVMAHWPSAFTDGGRVIELGCGTGKMLARLNQQFPHLELTGIDISPDMLAIARRKLLPPAVLIEDDVETDILNVRPPYDAALSLNVLHHLNDPEEHLLTLNSLVRPGGTVFLCDYAVDTRRLRFMEAAWTLLHPAHHRAYSQEKLKEMVAAAGFRIVEQTVLTPNAFLRLQIYRLEKPA